MDRLPWARFHWTIVVGLGAAWILDGLEIQIVSAIGSTLQDKGTLGLSSGQVGLLGSVYLFGEVVGALVFGRLTDRLGRKRLFILTLLLYLVASGIAAFSFSLWFLLIFRFVAGLGIGGEYTAINSAIDELIPSHYRGRVDIAINRMEGLNPGLTFAIADTGARAPGMAGGVVHTAAGRVHDVWARPAPAWSG